ncbi:MAG TPA: hypothetical protein VFV68_01125 [Agriterribacter sp.]|nr:hypothetical protein [Agriterribacter sp.]
MVNVLYAIHNPSSPKAMNKNEERVFIINAPIKNLDEFRNLVKQSLILKPFGKVKINISTLADKGFYEIPKKGSPWHEYASANPTPYKFFPDPKIAPFIPSDFVKKNRELLLAKAKILREYGLEAAFIGYEPNFLPAAFFDAYPDLLGPRVDHPRRSTEKAFAPCIGVRETQLMYANMMAELLKYAPEITSFSFKTNDAGAGICWAEWLYTGPNGPSHCKHFSTGERVQMLMNAFQEGAAKAGRGLSIYLDEGSSNFSEAERADIQSHLPADCYFLSNKNIREIENVGGTLSSLYPVTGIVNPVALLDQLSITSKNNNKTIFIGFRAAYDRGVEPADVRALILDLVERKLKNSPVQGPLSPMEELYQLSEEWGGKKSAGTLFNAFVALDEAMTYKAATFPRVHSLYWGVTERLINRPLLIAPQRLTPKEEAYFLPFIFNVSEEEARMDYVDVHGGRGSISPGVVTSYVSKIQKVAGLLENLDSSAPRKVFFQRMALSLRIHASIMRSCGNFAAAQVIRDRDSSDINGPTHRPGKEPSWTGHPDFIAFNNVMRDELDNINELINLLERGGLPLIITTADPAYEDRFLLSSAIVSQLRQKRKIMLDHWEDIQDYLASPFK